MGLNVPTEIKHVPLFPGYSVTSEGTLIGKQGNSGKVPSYRGFQWKYAF